MEETRITVSCQFRKTVVRLGSRNRLRSEFCQLEKLTEEIRLAFHLDAHSSLRLSHAGSGGRNIVIVDDQDLVDVIGNIYIHELTINAKQLNVMSDLTDRVASLEKEVLVLKELLHLHVNDSSIHCRHCTIPQNDNLSVSNISPDDIPREIEDAIENSSRGIKVEGDQG